MKSSNQSNSSIASRFWSKVKIGTANECWEWQASIRPTGYGQFAVKHKQIIMAHRFAWENIYGEIPSDMYVLHKCDNRKCVNPNHLWLGTLKDNARDMVAKGRFHFYLHPETRPRGEAHGQAKLTSKEVMEIRKKYTPQKYVYRQLAEEYKVSQTLISRIIRGEIWKHLI